MVSLTARLGSVQISSYGLSKFAAALTHLWPYARARRAATGRAAAELWGLCARPLAIEIGEGAVLAHCQARLGTNFEL